MLLFVRSGAGESGRRYKVETKSSDDRPTASSVS